MGSNSRPLSMAESQMLEVCPGERKGKGMEGGGGGSSMFLFYK